MSNEIEALTKRIKALEGKFQRLGGNTLTITFDIKKHVKRNRVKIGRLFGLFRDLMVCVKVKLKHISGRLDSQCRRLACLESRSRRPTGDESAREEMQRGLDDLDQRVAELENPI